MAGSCGMFFLPNRRQRMAEDLSRWRQVPGCAQQGDLAWTEDSAGGTPTDAVSSFAKASEDRETTALPEKSPVWGGRGQGN
jgi:hypothetical protein